MTRFVTPSYFTQPQHAAVEASLERLNIDDEEGVRVFLIALEYELAEHEKRVQAAPPAEAVCAPEQPPGLLQLAESASSLIEQIEALPQVNRELLLNELSRDDTFAREYGVAYLNAIVRELARLAACCNTHPAETVAPAGLSATDSHLVHAVAEAYFECFETNPTDGNGDHFLCLLTDIIEISGLKIAVSAGDLHRLLS